MPSIISNGAKIYRYGNGANARVLRSPLTKTLTLAPDEMAYYDVAGSYNSAMPTAGVIDTTGQNIYARAIRSGKQMRNLYRLVNQPDAQIWRGITQGHEPEFVFYHGAFSPSSSSYSGASYTPEAFLKIPAYHFTIPSEWSQFTVANARLSLTHGGCLITDGWPKDAVWATDRDSPVMPFYSRFCPTARLEADSQWRSNWTQSLGVYPSLSSGTHVLHPHVLHDTACQEVELDTAGTIAGKTDDLYEYQTATERYTSRVGLRKIWDNTFVDYYDGNIPTAYSTWNQNIQLNSSASSAISSLRGGWIVITPNVGISSLDDDTDTDSDYPFYYPSRSAGYPWWLCCSYWGFRLTVNLELA